ncbi:type I restriction endonuclease subunit R [Nocardiopsis sp. M1B1]|uniref:type I restriction endonuclease subunit R n=1 Tax=Nocardiopsis sp. M1B1 TaxID=3450454 RepID=UPI00403A071B
MSAPEGRSPHPSGSPADATPHGASPAAPTGPEWELTEKPLLDQLTAMGWTPRQLADGEERTSRRDVILEDTLKAALRRINTDDQGREWLDESRLDQAVSALTRPRSRTLIEINEELTALLLTGTEVDGVEGWQGGRRQSVRYIDFDNPERNDFHAVRQFVVDGPGADRRGRIVPDLVLFVNGIPLVVIEAKSPDVHEPMAQAIDQLRRYAGQRSEVSIPEGNARLFHTNQFVVAACGTNARAAGFTAGPEHFAEWKTTEPRTPEEVAAELGLSDPDQVNGQQRLAAGMLRPSILLDLVRHFTLFMDTGGRMVKVVARYQQYRAVRRSVHRMLTEPTRLQDGEFDRRGGIVWHTQGSGKSLTMVFLVRAMRSEPGLVGFKVVVVTDRTQLQTQLSRTMALTGESGETIAKVEELAPTLAIRGKGLYFAMIHKYRGESDAPTGSAGSTSKATEPPESTGPTESIASAETEKTGETSDADQADPWETEETEEAETGKRKEAHVPTLGVLDDSPEILILVDEAHRSHTSKLHANLMAALPNAVRVGFTGTPIIMGDKERFTGRIFGQFIDSYTIRQSEEDGATVPIVYEGRTARAHVRDGEGLDGLFTDMVDLTPEQREELKKRYGTKNAVLEAEELISAKAADMFAHYVDTILPNGFKAQVVAVSRRAAVRYQAALLSARDAFVAELDRLPGDLRTPEAVEAAQTDLVRGTRAPRTARLVRARPHRDLVARLDAAAVISASHNDSADWRGWTRPSAQDQRIEEFKKPLPVAEGAPADETSTLAFLTVNAMLLTGFDAPNEQILYLDRHLKQAELLQAIARVNRTASGKGVGYVIDYYGVSRHLSEALKAYAAEDIEGALSSIRDEVPLLRDRRERVRRVFTGRGLDRFDTDEAREECVQLLADDGVRHEFRTALKAFNRSMETVLPRPEALEFVPDARDFGTVDALARARYREGGGFDPSLYGGKVRELIDQHVHVHDVRGRIAPVAITDVDFDARVDALTSDRARASEMEHALRHHISENLDLDPELYGGFAERLEHIISAMDGNWDEMVRGLSQLRAEVLTGRRGDDDTGLTPDQRPFYELIKGQLEGESELEEELRVMLCELTVEIIDLMRTELHREGYNASRSEKLGKEVAMRLFRARGDGGPVFGLSGAKTLAPQLVRLAEFRMGR